MRSFSPLTSDFAFRLLCLHGEEPHDTPFELLALLLFALPLEFTLQKFVDDDAIGERSHQLFAEPQRKCTAHNLYALRQVLVPCLIAFLYGFE